jgi:glycerol kinase
VKPEYILAFDQGTTSSRSVLFDRRGRAVGVGQREFTQHYPRPGWVEHDPVELWQSQYHTALDAIAAASARPAQIAGIGMTNQRETTIIWDRGTGRAIAPAIVWQDRRTSDTCSRIREAHGDLIRTRTGLEVDAYFSASKIAWLLDNVPGARKRAEHGELAFGTVDTWLVWNLTAGGLHITDTSNASRTMLFDIQRLEWDDELLSLFNVPRALLPEVKSSSEIYGEVAVNGPLAGLPIAGIAGDQQAALFGQRCFARGDAKNTYGTGCFLLENVGTECAVSTNRLLSTVGWTIDGVTEYALEGSVFIGGAVFQWLRDSLGLFQKASDVEALARSAEDNGGVYFVPAFAGLGAPHWDQDARGTIVGLTRGTTAAHLARAALESIAFQSAEVLNAMELDSGVKLATLRVDGGAVKNDLLMQFQADLLQLPVERSHNPEATALGAAYLAGLASGFWASRDEFADHSPVERTFYPAMPASEADRLNARWRDAVERSRHWEQKKGA